MDNDKVVASCTNIVYYIVSPAMKGKSRFVHLNMGGTAPFVLITRRPMDVETTVVTIIQEMTKIPAALKTWRPPVAELLSDNRLFNCTSEDAEKWKPIMKSLFDLDKAAFPELLGTRFVLL
jgi:hypothetical protein